ncbi:MULTISPECIES: hypothetical protein [Pseudomonas]|jgi:hypothetical protein|uniref:Uncharacterized protein n=1 Tax=Pseudomonas synxantha TaxID=47883 RepID=A0A5D3G5I7_9PSED|nr:MULTISPECIES: hypothetical protein [Pseudomonas]KFF45399.1 hypothetical protein JH25_16855 [Pseudomonas sp. BRG-100]MBY8969471.1 hypothetical protein [Pseudomonas sp. P867]MCK3824976.1 hypothetical protein [Pseudomonas sp. W2Aug9]MCK3830872.1 hypothetical protein [Pseudomonas fluorescens]MCK3836495.1 hypothetical protein [Pseudomonas sp. NCIMB 10586]
MQWFPTPPTDNLYKFAAVCGLLMLGGALFAILSLAYLDYRIEVQTNASLDNFSNQHNQRLFENRITALKEGDTEKDYIPQLSKKLNNDPDFLAAALKIQSELKAGYKPADPDTLDLVFNFVRAREALSLIALVIYALVASWLTVFGLSGWRKKIHGPNERQNELDEEIKKASLLKLHIEISQMQPMSETVKKLFELGGIMRPDK